jgi:hypothetical protein
LFLSMSFPRRRESPPSFASNIPITIIAEQ